MQPPLPRAVIAFPAPAGVPRLRGLAVGRRVRARSTRGARRPACHPHPRPAPPRLRVLHAGGARGRATGRAGRDHTAAAHPGDVRAGGPGAPTPRPLPRLSRPERRVHRHLRGAVRVGRARHAHLRAGGRVRAVRRPAAAAVREAGGARTRAAAGGADQPHAGRERGVDDALRRPRAARRPGGRRPRRPADRAVLRRRHRPHQGWRRAGCRRRTRPWSTVTRRSDW